MSDLDHQKPGGKSARSKKKRNKKAERQQNLAPQQAQAESAVAAAIAAEEMIEDAAAVEAALAEPEAARAEPEAAEPEAAPAEPVERVASFRERMASVMPPPDISSAKPAAPAQAEKEVAKAARPDVAKEVPSPAAAPAAGIQAIAEAYRDYTRKSLEDAQSFAEKLSAARSLDKAVEAQTEFARQACETFADNSRKIRELHRELFWQAFRLPNWPLGRSR